MTTEAVKTAWITKIANNSQIQAITKNFYTFDITAVLNSKTEIAYLYDNENKINFVKLVISRRALDTEARATATTASLYEYDVEFTYYLEKDISDTEWNAGKLTSTIELIDVLVRTELGSKWNNTVRYWSMSGILSPRIVELDNKSVWQGGYSYLAKSYE